MIFIKKNIKKIGIVTFLSGAIALFVGAVNLYVDFKSQSEINKVKYHEMQNEIKTIKINETDIYLLIKKIQTNVDENNKNTAKNHKELSGDLTNLTSDIKELTYIIIRNNKNMEKDFNMLKNATNVTTTTTTTKTFSTHGAIRKNKSINVADVITINNKKLAREFKTLHVFTEERLTLK